MNRLSQGFTLIELSIVLVVIGLIFGSILVGESLVKSAGAQSQIKQMTELETRMNTFRLKYGCYPGDCANATTFFGTADTSGNAILNGNSDGQIHSSGAGGTPPNCLSAPLAGNNGGETLQFFLHLNLAQLGTYTANGLNDIMGIGYPVTAINNSVGLFVTCTEESGVWLTNHPASWLNTTVGNNILVIGVLGPNDAGRSVYNFGFSNSGFWNGYNFVSSATITKGIDVRQARMIDQKIDDAGSNTGVIGVISGCISYYQTGCSNYQGTGGGCTSLCSNNPYVVMGKILKN